MGSLIAKCIAQHVRAVKKIFYTKNYLANDQGTKFRKVNIKVK